MGDNFKKISNSVITNRSTLGGSNDSGNKPITAKPKDAWYKKPIGIIFIGVLVFVIGKYIAHKLGL